MAGGWWYLWTDGGVQGWGLAARAWWWACVRCLWRPCVPCQCCAPCVGMVVSRVAMAWGRFSWLVEQEFEEVGLVCLGQGCCMLKVFVGAVCQLLCCLGNGRPLHVRRCGVGVFRPGA